MNQPAADMIGGTMRFVADDTLTYRADGGLLHLWRSVHWRDIPLNTWIDVIDRKRNTFGQCRLIAFGDSNKGEHISGAKWEQAPPDWSEDRFHDNDFTFLIYLGCYKNIGGGLDR